MDGGMDGGNSMVGDKKLGGRDVVLGDEHPTKGEREKLLCDHCALPIHHEDNVRSILLGSEHVSAILMEPSVNLYFCSLGIRVLTWSGPSRRTDQAAPGILALRYELCHRKHLPSIGY